MNGHFMVPLFDTHAHLDDEQFDGIREAVIDRAVAAGVQWMIAMGTTASTSRQCCQIAASSPHVWASVGIQPNNAHEATLEDWSVIQGLVSQDRVVALGETGLDRYWDRCPFEIQVEWFERHVRLSQETQLPFIVHMRECEEDIIETLTRCSDGETLNGVMHSFTGSIETAEAAMELGLDISFAGMVTFKNAADLREVASQIPLDRLLIETDAPYLAPHPKRGQRPNEPALLVHTAQCLADVHGVSYEELARQTTCNACRRFGITP
jgi:TatD DNase family protein